MRFFFDTEFLEDGTTIELISIGIVAEDGREYYAETENSAYLAKSTDWLVDNVYPHLRQDRPSAEARIAEEIIEFVGERPEFWAYFADYDWVVLCQLFGRMIDLPSGWPMYCRDLKQFMDHAGFKRDDLPPQDGAEHNALADARWVKAAWEHVNGHCIWELRYD